MTDDQDGPSAPDGPEGMIASFDRRRYLQLLAAASVLGGGSGGAAAADHGQEDESNGDGETVEVPEDGWDDWEAAADERIQEHRTADLTVEVADADGTSMNGVDVAVEMREHAYGFGTAVNAGTLIEETRPGDEYREKIPELFNEAVLENHHKWRFWEENTELADAATDWLLDRSLEMRGHVALWANVSAWAVPPDVVSAMGVEWEDNGVTDPELDPEHVEERTTEHVTAIIEHYGCDIVDWEVHNETIHEPGLIEAANGVDADDEDAELDVPAVEAPVLAEWHRIAERARGPGTSLTVNDYNVLVGPYDYAREAYVRQIEFLLDEGIDLGGIGMQCHFSEDETLSPRETVEGLNLYAEYGPDLRVTEFDMGDENWADEDKAEFLRQFLKLVYSHPATTDFLMWGFWDGRHWQGQAPLFYGPDDEEHDNWEPKPTHDEYTGLVFDEWWTDESGATDGGSFDATVYLGDHDVTVTFDDGPFVADVAVDEPAEETVTITLAEAEVKGNPDRENGTIPVEVSGGDAFAPADLDFDAVRLGTPDAVNAGEGASVANVSGCRSGEGQSDQGCTLQFEAADVDLDGDSALLTGETEDGQLVAAFASL